MRAFTYRALLVALCFFVVGSMGGGCNAIPAPPPYLLGTQMTQRMSTAGGELHFGGALATFASAADVGFSVQTSRNIALGLDGYGIFGYGYGGRAALRANPIGDHLAFVFGAGGGAIAGSGVPYGTLDAGIVAGLGGPRDFFHANLGASVAQSFTFGIEQRVDPTLYGIAQASLWIGPPQIFSVGLTGTFTVYLDLRDAYAYWLPGGAITFRIPLNDHGP